MHWDLDDKAYCGQLKMDHVILDDHSHLYAEYSNVLLLDHTPQYSCI